MVDCSKYQIKSSTSDRQCIGKSSLSYKNQKVKNSNKIEFVLGITSENEKEIHFRNQTNKDFFEQKVNRKQADGPPSYVRNRVDRRTCFRCHEIGHVVYQCPLTSPTHVYVCSEVGPVVVNQFKSENQNFQNLKSKNMSVNVKSVQNVHVKKDLPKHSYQRKTDFVNNVSVKPKFVEVVDLDDCKVSKLKSLSFYVKRSTSKLQHWIALTKNTKSKPENDVVDKEPVVVTPDKHVLSE